MANCEKCGKKLGLTTHYCLGCLREKTKEYEHHEKKNLNGEVKAELARLAEEGERIRRGSFYNIKMEYSEILKERPLLFSELQINIGKFVKIIRQLKYENCPIHLYKFKYGRLPEGIAFMAEHKEMARTKLKSIYPELRLPQGIFK